MRWSMSNPKKGQYLLIVSNPQNFIVRQVNLLM